MPREFRNPWGTATCRRVVRLKDKTVCHLAHDFGRDYRGEIEQILCRSSRVLSARFSEDELVVVVAHTNWVQRRKESHKQYVRRMQVDVASSLGQAFACLGREVKRQRSAVRSYAEDRRTSIRRTSPAVA